MLTSQAQLTNSDLNYLTAAVPRYPISVKSLISLARRQKLPPKVARFYSYFPDSVTFDNEDSLVARTQQVEILRSEEQNQPLEDQVRGAED